MPEPYWTWAAKATADQGAQDSFMTDAAARAAERIRTIGSLPVQETSTIIREETAADVRELVASLCLALPEPITGDVALSVSRLIHAAGLDSPGQWGCAYFRCPDCGEARDCCARPDEQCSSCDSCDHDYTVDDLVISEGWVERDARAVLAKHEGA